MPSIPKKIHLIYKTQIIPEEYQPYFESMKIYHSKWEIVVYSDEQARSVILTHLPELVETYDQLLLNVQRTDLFRLVVVYLFGGFYLDLDMLCYKSLDELCNNGLVLGEEKTLSAKYCLEAKVKDPVRIANYMFGAVPQHPFLSAVINEITANAKTTIKHEDDVLNTTGPGLLTMMYHLKKDSYDDITLIYNYDKKCMRLCETISCHFGEYAAHFHLGHWRWDK